MFTKFFRMIFLFCLISAFLFSEGYVYAGCRYYYVSMTGNDKNPGSISYPFRTIQKGCDVLKPGDVLNIKAGRYIEKIILKNSGTASARIMIQNYAKDRVIVDGSGIEGRSDIFLIKNKSYIVLKGLELCNSEYGDTPTGILINGYGKGIEINSNKIYSIKSDDNAHGIAAYGTNGVNPINGLVIKYNKVYDCVLGSSEAVVVNGNVESFTISDNTIYNNNNIGICCIGFEGTSDKNDQARYGKVSNNKVYGISSRFNPAYDGDACADGIYVDGGRDIVIERNIVSNCDIGIEAASEHYNKSATNIEVRNNIVYGCSLYGLSFGGYSGLMGYADGCKFYNNTFYNNGIGISVNKSKNNMVFNNIVYENGLLLEGEIKSNDFSHNIWYSPKGDTQGLTVFADPRFKNPQEYDFHLLPGSPAINAGDPSYKNPGNVLDFDGRVRISNGRIDCGAYENQGSKPVLPG